LPLPVIKVAAALAYNPGIDRQPGGLTAAHTSSWRQLLHMRACFDSSLAPGWPASRGLQLNPFIVS